MINKAFLIEYLAYYFPNINYELKPIITSNSYEPQENILYFGVCSGSKFNIRLGYIIDCTTLDYPMAMPNTLSDRISVNDHSLFTGYQIIFERNVKPIYDKLEY